MNGIFRRRHLPHWDVEGHPFFITACLKGSISAIGLRRIRHFREALDARHRPRDWTPERWEHHKNKLLFGMIDELLDTESPVRHLADHRQAEIVQNAFLHFAGDRYDLLAFVVMPSHHHWIFLPKESWARTAVTESRWAGRNRTPREIISHSIQSYTATMCNRVRGTNGPYWQTETFDHWARDEAEVQRIIRYIEDNPVRAGLVSEPADWPFSSARLRERDRIPPGLPLMGG